METRNGDWIQTYTGRQYWPTDPRPTEVNLDDIAHSLSLTCRFTGHCREFYSVAEHSVHVSNLVARENALVGLLHDATEAYLTDIARPVKRSLPDYKKLEALNWIAVADHFGLPLNMPQEVKDIDYAICFVEKDYLMGPSPAPWGGEEASKALRLHHLVRPECWAPKEAKLYFLQRFYELQGLLNDDYHRGRQAQVNSR